MSLVSYDLTVNRRTPQRTPTSVEIDIDKPYVTFVELAFPDGPFGAMGIRLMDRGKQFAPDPRASNAWIRDNQENVAWSEEHELDGPPWKIQIEGYNLSGSNDHRVQIRIGISEWILAKLIAELNDNMAELAARIRR